MVEGSKEDYGGLLATMVGENKKSAAVGWQNVRKLITLFTQMQSL